MKLSEVAVLYVAHKQSIGMRFRTEQRILKSFCRAMGEIAIADVQANPVLAFISGTGPVTRFWHRKYEVLSGFYRFAISRGYCAVSPLPRLVPKRPPAFVPYIYSHDELRRLLEATSLCEHPCCKVRAHTFRALILLLYGAGLRISEAHALTLNDLDLSTALIQIRETKFQVGVRDESVNDALVALNTANHQFDFTEIRAPFPGVVVKRYRNLGDFASPGVAILSMYNPELTYVTANLEETRLPGVAPGNAVELQVDAFDRPFRGRVVWIDKSTGAQFALMPRNVVSGEFTKVVQRVPVRIRIERDKRWSQLRAGLSVRAVISHGDGDPDWAEQAASEMRALETRYNRP